MWNTATFGETVTHQVWTKTGQDADGNDDYDFVPVVYRRCSAYPKVSKTFGGETQNGQGVDYSTSLAVVLLPYSTVVQSSDRFDVWGVRWEADGECIRYKSGFTGRRFLQVNLLRIEGA